VVADGGRRWPEVVGGSGCPLLASKVVEKWSNRPTHMNRAWLIWAFVEAHVRVLVAAHSGGGLRGSYGEQLVAVFGGKSTGTVARKLRRAGDGDSTG